MHVLVVDDEDDICLMISRILISKNINCDYVHTIRQSKQKAIDKYDLFIIDINLPDGTGLELISYLNDLLDDPTIVTISAYDDQEVIEEAFELGSSKFVKKPFTKSEILALV